MAFEILTLLIVFLTIVLAGYLSFRSAIMGRESLVAWFLVALVVWMSWMVLPFITTKFFAFHVIGGPIGFLLGALIPVFRIIARRGRRG